MSKFVDKNVGKPIREHAKFSYLLSSDVNLLLVLCNMKNCNFTPNKRISIITKICQIISIITLRTTFHQVKVLRQRQTVIRTTFESQTNQLKMKQQQSVQISVIQPLRQQQQQLLIPIHQIYPYQLLPLTLYQPSAQRKRNLHHFCIEIINESRS